MSDAQKIATELGELPIALGAGVANDEQWLNAEINRLNRRSVLPLAQVRELHEWLRQRLDAVIKPDEQVYNRFRAHRRFGKLLGQEFKDTVVLWENKVIAF